MISFKSRQCALNPAAQPLIGADMGELYAAVQNILQNQRKLSAVYLSVNFSHNRVMNCVLPAFVFESSYFSFYFFERN